MTINKETIVSVQVLLRAADGTILTGHEAITAANIQRYSPDPAKAARTAEYFRGLGFNVGDVVGVSFSISAPASLFEKAFSLKLEEGERGSALTVWPDGSRHYEYPAHLFPAPVRDNISHIAFSPPLDFGPVGYMK